MFLPRNAGITSGRASRRTLFPSGVLSQVYDARRAGSAQPEGRRPRATRPPAARASLALKLQPLRPGSYRTRKSSTGVDHQLQRHLLGLEARWLDVHQ